MICFLAIVSLTCSVLVALLGFVGMFVVFNGGDPGAIPFAVFFVFGLGSVATWFGERWMPF